MSQINVPFLDLRQQMESLRSEIDEAVAEVLDSCAFANGPQVKAFEADFADYCQTSHAVAVNSGTAALVLALQALEIGEGDEVIVPAMSFIATAAAVVQCGATPVFCDIDPLYHTLSPDMLTDAITPRTKAIMPVHLYGQAAEWAAIQSIAQHHGLALIEDAAQAHGATFEGQRCGSLGDIACFSFYPGKNLGGAGEGGAITTNREELAERVCMLRDWGQKGKYNHVALGTNARMDSIQAAVLGIKLRRLESWTEARRFAASSYLHAMTGLPGLRLPAERGNCRHVYHVFPICSERRDALRILLQQQGIATGLHYPTPLHLQPCLSYLGYKDGDFPNAEKLAREELSLPLFPEMTYEQIHGTISALGSTLHPKAGTRSPFN